MGTNNAVWITQSGNGTDFDLIGDQSLDDFHKQAGGTTATSATINDADVRAVNWYGTIYGSTPASGATMNFYEFIYPRRANATWTLRPAPPNIGNATGSAGSQHYCAVTDVAGQSEVPGGGGGGQASFAIASYFNVAARTDGTKTYIEVQTYDGTRLGYLPIGSSTSVAGFGWHQICEINEKFDLVALQTTLDDKDDYLTPATGANVISSDASSDTDLNVAPQAALSVTHLTSNGLTSFTTMVQGSRYGRRAEAEAFAQVDVSSDTAASSAETNQIFRHTFRFIKYPTSVPTVLQSQDVVICVKNQANADADVY